MNTDGARRWAQLTKAEYRQEHRYRAGRLRLLRTERKQWKSLVVTHRLPVTLLRNKQRLGKRVKIGKMPAPAHIVQEDIVGPSLGQASINAGIMSFIVALILLMVYMCSMYGFIPVWLPMVLWC